MLSRLPHLETLHIQRRTVEALSFQNNYQVIHSSNVVIINGTLPDSICKKDLHCFYLFFVFNSCYKQNERKAVRNAFLLTRPTLAKLTPLNGKLPTCQYISHYVVLFQFMYSRWHKNLVILVAPFLVEVLSTNLNAS